MHENELAQGSFLVWKHLFQSGLGEGKRCLDVGCGAGVLAIQLALNGAGHVDAIDIQREAVANTLANAVRNDVSDRVRGRVVDLYTYRPKETYDLVVASLYQMPVDPMGETTSHRSADFWGRNMLDHLISLLPDLLEKNGVAYLMQISVLSQLRTAELLEETGFDCRVVDFSFFPFSDLFHQNIEQIQRVEELSDAFHLSFGKDSGHGHVPAGGQRQTVAHVNLAFRGGPGFRRARQSGVPIVAKRQAFRLDGNACQWVQFGTGDNRALLYQHRDPGQNAQIGTGRESDGDVYCAIGDEIQGLVQLGQRRKIGDWSAFVVDEIEVINEVRPALLALVLAEIPERLAPRDGVGTDPVRERVGSAHLGRNPVVTGFGPAGSSTPCSH